MRVLTLLGDLPIQFDRAAGSDGVMDLARRHRLTAYDAAYLELAQRERVPLATLDGALMRAASAESVALLDAGLV